MEKKGNADANNKKRKHDKISNDEKEKVTKEDKNVM